MARLVNAMRDGIIDRMMAHTFDDRIRALCSEQAECALAAYNDVYSSTVRKRMEELPKDWLPKRNEIQCKVEDEYISLTFGGEFPGSPYSSRNFPEFRNIDGIGSKSCLVPYDNQSGCLKVYEPSHKIAHKVVDFKRHRDDLQEAYKNAGKQLSVTLNRFHTVEKLIEEWPEVAPFINEKDRPVPATAIALPVKDLNAMFKLPVAGDA